MSAYRDTPGHFVGYFYGAYNGKVFWFEGQTRGEVQQALDRHELSDARIVDMDAIDQCTDDELDLMHAIATGPHHRITNMGWFGTARVVHVSARSLSILKRELKRRAYDPSRP